MIKDYKMFEKTPDGLKYIRGSWRKMFKVDWFALLLIVTILLACYSYYHDTRECFKVLADPCSYCNGYVKPVFMGNDSVLVGGGIGGFNFSQNDT